MKKTKKQKERIIENIYDIVLNTRFAKEAKKQMEKDLKNKNIMFDKDEGSIRIQNIDATITQYKITIN